jgi:1-deoxy-D-xylulose-5-phosphate reductoisomerase
MADAEMRTDESRRVIVLGSTGSIGVSTLEVVAHLQQTQPDRFSIAGLAAGANAPLLLDQAKQFNPDMIALADEETPDALANAPCVTCAGPDSALELIEAVARPGDLVVAAMVGAAGLPAAIAAIERGCDIALANKETLVAAGSIVMPLAARRGVNLIPVDSEHSAISQCLRSGRSIDEVKRLVLTASGGPFRTWTAEATASAPVEAALNHPTWSMGRKITIDSASLMNKALEVIEAYWLFDAPSDRIDVVVHPQSIIHSFVEFVDGSVIAQMGPPDMRTPIQYALTWPERTAGCSNTMDWAALKSLEFEPVDHQRFPAIALARRVIDEGGAAGAVFNAANEVAVAAYLDQRIAFGDIPRIVQTALDAVRGGPVIELADVLAADAAARRAAEKAIPDGVGRIGASSTPAV